jgi:hypothetical protein
VTLEAMPVTNITSLSVPKESLTLGTAGVHTVKNVLTCDAEPLT